MTKNEYIAKVLMTHQINLLRMLNTFDMGALDAPLAEIASSLNNVAAELKNMPSPAMASGSKRLPFEPKPSSTVVRPKPSPRKPAPAAMVATA